MFWLVLAIIIIVVIVAAILFLNRFYRKASRDVSLIRTGAGGQRVVLDGGVLALPFLHKVSEVNMKTTRLEIKRHGERSMITSDRLRVDASVEFYVRVQPTEDGVATAAQAFGGKSFRAEELAELLEGKLVDAILAVGARYTMDELQDQRGKFVAEVSEGLQNNLALNGLILESVSLTRLDQTPFHALDENNAFNALGMRRLAEIIATNKKERAAIEAESATAVRQSELEAAKKTLLIQQEEEEARIAQQLEIEKHRATSQAEIAEEQAQSEERREQARIKREREVRVNELQKNRDLRRIELEANLASETVRHDNAIKLAAKQSEEARAEAEVEAARAEQLRAQELAQTARETAAAERERAVAVIRAAEQAEVDDTRVKSEAETVLAMAKAQAEAMEIRAEAVRKDALARAAGEEAMIAAENLRAGEVIRMKVDLEKLKTLPQMVTQMMKPVEKIESIRVNHITGFGGTSGGGSTGEGGDKAVVNQVVDGILSMALQLPAVNKLGEEIGLNIGGGLKGLTHGNFVEPSGTQDNAGPSGGGEGSEQPSKTEK